jgi:FixJ family two-component response regulator
MTTGVFDNYCTYALAEAEPLKSLNLLSQREQEVVILLLRGLGIVEIAKVLSLSRRRPVLLRGVHLQSSIYNRD